jgi:hypothetical protein
VVQTSNEMLATINMRRASALAAESLPKWREM